jgi:hypothetical protein
MNTGPEVVSVGFDFHSNGLRNFAKHSGIERLIPKRAAHLLFWDRFPDAPYVLVTQTVSREPLGRQLQRFARKRKIKFKIASDNARAAALLGMLLNVTAPLQERVAPPASKNKPRKPLSPEFAREIALINAAMAGRDFRIVDGLRYGFRSSLGEARLPESAVPSRLGESFLEDTEFSGLSGQVFSYRLPSRK